MEVLIDDFSEVNFNLRIKNRIIKFFRRLYLQMTEFTHVEMNIKNKPFMITPCNHYFHASCLESWLKHKRECPTCRNETPSML